MRHTPFLLLTILFACDEQGQLVADVQSPDAEGLMARADLFSLVTNDSITAWADSQVGPCLDTDTANIVYELELTQAMVDAADDAIDDGDPVHVTFGTRTSSAVLNLGTTNLSGTVTLELDGTQVGSWDHSDSSPGGGGTHVDAEDHSFTSVSTWTAGDTLRVSAQGTGTSTAPCPNLLRNQANLLWNIHSGGKPYLKIGY